MEQKSGDLKLFLATVGDFITEIEKKGSGQQKKKNKKTLKLCFTCGVDVVWEILIDEASGTTS